MKKTDDLSYTQFLQDAQSLSSQVERFFPLQFNESTKRKVSFMKDYDLISHAQ